MEAGRISIINHVNHTEEDVYFHDPGKIACCHLYLVVRDRLKYAFQGLFLFSKWLKEGNCNHKTVLLNVKKGVNESFFV